MGGCFRGSRLETVHARSLWKKKVLIVRLENNLFWKQMRVGDTPHSGGLEFEFPSLEVGKTV